MMDKSLPTEETTTLSLWDRIGMALSGLCVIHCLLFPIVLASLPLWALGEELHGWLHPVFAVLLIPTTLLAVRTARRKHHHLLPPVLLIAGLIIVLIGGTAGHYMPGAVTETLITTVGSVTLITGHGLNWHRCRNCDHDHSACAVSPEKVAGHAAA